MSYVGLVGCMASLHAYDRGWWRGRPQVYVHDVDDLTHLYYQSERASNWLRALDMNDRYAHT